MKDCLRDLRALANKVKKDLRNNYVVWLGRVVCYSRIVSKTWHEVDRQILQKVLNFGKANKYYLLPSLVDLYDVYNKRQFVKLLKRLENFSALIFNANVDFVCKLLIGR